jgi:hypothetical protein
VGADREWIELDVQVAVVNQPLADSFFRH